MKSSEYSTFRLILLVITVYSNMVSCKHYMCQTYSSVPNLQISRNLPYITQTCHRKCLGPVDKSTQDKHI
jgi:hypothetical protein